MSTVSTRKVITTRHEYILPLPSNWAEVNKATAMALQEFKATGRAASDDSIWFTADDEHIIIYWEAKQ